MSMSQNAPLSPEMHHCFSAYLLKSRCVSRGKLHLLVGILVTALVSEELGVLLIGPNRTVALLDLLKAGNSLFAAPFLYQPLSLIQPCGLLFICDRRFERFVGWLTLLFTEKVPFSGTHQQVRAT
jgi:hypothetical protein